MAITYGNGYRPIAVGLRNEPKDLKKEIGFSALRIATTIAAIALSFIPIAGEAAGVATEAIAETIGATATVVRLGDTISGTIGLGLAEATANEEIDRAQGVNTLGNELINFGLSVGIPILGSIKGRLTANTRFLKATDLLIKQQKELLTVAKTSEDVAQIERRISQLKNAKLIRTNKLFDTTISSSVTSIAKKEVKAIIEGSESTTVKKIAKELIDKMNINEIKLSKTEARAIVRTMTKKIPSISEGLTLTSIVQSRTYNSLINAARYLDPSLAARKILTGATRKLTSNEALLNFGEKEYGKWFKKVNIGLYKKFGKKLSAFWRKWGQKLYAHSRVKMIPVVSEWIDGYRLIPLSPLENIMIVLFKPSKNGRIPEPVVVKPVSTEFALEFAAGGEYGSVGSFYIEKIALARNGSSSVITSSLGSILGPLSLGTLRQALAGPAAFERLFKKMSSGDYFQKWTDDFTEAGSRLWSHKVGKVLAGRWGIATARGFQHKKNGKTVFTSKFNLNPIIEEIGVVTLDKARSVQRKAGIKGRTAVIGGRRTLNQYKRLVKLGTFGYYKFDSKQGFKKSKGIF